MTRRYLATITPDRFGFMLALTDAGATVRTARGIPDPESAADLAVVFAEEDTVYQGGMVDSYRVQVVIRGALAA